MCRGVATIGFYLPPTTDWGDANDLFAQATALEQNFKVYSFDFRAALVAAGITSHPDYDQLRKELGRSRAVMNADSVIVATAKSNGVSRAYSDDTGFRSIAARAGLECLALPTLEELLAGTHAPPSRDDDVPDPERPLIQLDLGLNFDDEEEAMPSELAALVAPDDVEDWPDQMD